MMQMPVLFVGHGSPMNAIEDNQFTAKWKTLGVQMPRPKAILSVSAHWFSKGLFVMDTPSPKTIYDMYGFPEALYQVTYDAPGAPHFAHVTRELLGDSAQIDNSWGLDHGTWSVLCRIYPEADIPVFQLSVNSLASAEECYEIGQKLRPLRDEGVLILGSGNIVHNLRRVNWNMEKEGYPWAEEFDQYIRDNILSRSHENVIDYRLAGSSAAHAFSSPDHFAPLLYVLGASLPEDSIYVFNKSCSLGSLSMTSYMFG